MNVDDQPERDLIEEYQETTALVRKNNNLIKELIERYEKMSVLKREKFNNKDFEVVPPFEGKVEQLPRFLRALDYLAAEYEVTRYTNHLVPFLLHVEAKLKGAVAHQIGLGNYQTWDALREKLILAYDDKRDSATLAEELGVMSQKPNETPMQFYERIILHYDQMLAKLLLECNSNKDIVKGVTENYLDKRVLRRLMNGLKEPNKQFLKTRNPTTLEEAHSLLATFAQPDLVEIRTRGSGQSWQNKNNLNSQNKTVSNNQKTPFATKTSSPQNTQQRNLNQNWRNNNFKQNSNFNPNNKGPEPMSVQTRVNQLESVEQEEFESQDDFEGITSEDYEPVNFRDEASDSETLNMQTV
ncbi:hypothetical protein BC332_34571 [Capsicum chinense]|uniref:Gag protein n=1 Tax=Bemisia tabaci TaxID=7038 RepID=A0A9P0A5I5_BEMTA|nr:hypothetical protein BC332_34571 [Capsicum chinense]CAH0384724.1 unnamed protein product [Bemisia tabaci]